MLFFVQTRVLFRCQLIILLSNKIYNSVSQVKISGVVSMFDFTTATERVRILISGWNFIVLIINISARYHPVPCVMFIFRRVRAYVRAPACLCRCLCVSVPVHACVCACFCMSVSVCARARVRVHVHACALQNEVVTWPRTS